MDTILLAADYNQMWTVTAAGVSIVFLVLLILVTIFYLFGFIMQRFSKGNNKNEKKISKSNSIKEEKKDKQNVSLPKVAPLIKVVDNGISPEVVAAISAAIACYNDGNQYTIHSIKKHQVSSSRPAWAMAGMADNTRPF